MPLGLAKVYCYAKDQKGIPSTYTHTLCAYHMSCEFWKIVTIIVKQDGIAGCLTNKYRNIREIESN